MLRAGRARTARLLAAQGEACAQLGSPLYAGLLERASADVLAGGVVAEVLDGHEDDPGPSALALRLLGGVHRLVLERRAPALTAHYPSMGGVPGPPDAVWAASAAVLAADLDEVRAGLARPPQTNEVGRGAALLGGLLHVVARHRLPVRLVEVGASGGLNLRVDRFRIDLADGRSWGPVGSPVVLADAWRGAVPPLDAPLQVVSRRGCDPAPVDPTTPEGELALTAYVWPDQRARLERLRGALSLAAQVPAQVVPAGAGVFLRGIELTPGTVTVLWHSVVWQYLAREERAAVTARVTELGAAATTAAPFAHLSLEPQRRHPEDEHEFLVTLRAWPGDEERVLGTASPHGPPVVWE